jgi:dihydropteroate synthase
VPKDTVFPALRTIKIKGKPLVLDQPLIMGILNLTGDSFFSGSRVQSEAQLLEKAEKMLSEGADILDLGASSTRPGAQAVDQITEQQRIQDAVRILRKAFPDSILSLDTYRADVAEIGLQEGADMINDVSGGQLDNNMHAVVAKWDVPYVLMHMRGTPETMQNLTEYADPVKDIVFWFSQQIHSLHAKGIADIIVDPGIGFAKTAAQNFELLRRLESFHTLDCPLLIGISRKSFLHRTLNTSPEEALNATTFMHFPALLKGAKILRVHDVQEVKQCRTLIQHFLK